MGGGNGSKGLQRPPPAYCAARDCATRPRAAAGLPAGVEIYYERPRRVMTREIPSAADTVIVWSSRRLGPSRDGPAEERAVY